MRYNEERCTVELSVRELCETALRSGDLGGNGTYEAMIDGARIHRQLQMEAGVYYNPEVSLTNTVMLDGMYYTVSGRADGVLREKEGLTVDEIKCVRKAMFFAPVPEVFVAQLKCYAYFLAVRDDLTSIRGRVTYYNTDTKKTKYFRYDFTVDELHAYYISLLKRVKRRAELVMKRKTERLPKAAAARFPYSGLREGQEIMIRECYRAIRKKKRLFIEAPTGTGKTVSSLYPAVRALGEGRIDKIFYLTAKASTRSEAFRAASALYSSGAPLRTVVVTAKEQMCICARRGIPSGTDNRCEPRECDCAKDYYERVDSAIFELIEGGNGYPRRLIEQTAKKYRVCPYELSLDLSELCDIVICDYNYAFDPSVYFRRYFSDNTRGERYIFLIDEAHNLADRARAMYSATLSRNRFEEAIGLFDPAENEPISACESALKAFMPMRALCREELTKDAQGNEMGYFSAKTPLPSFCEAMELFKHKSDAWLRKHREHPSAPAFSRLASDVRRFLLVNEYFDKGFLTYVQIFGGDITVQTCCLDPSAIMNALLSRASSSVLFSATLAPDEYYRSLLGGAKSSEYVSLPSPFDPARLSVTVADYVSTRYGERDKHAARFATLIAASVTSRAGNYIAYFPSYSVLEDVLGVFKRKYPRVETVVQKRNMSAKEKEEFLM